MNKQTKKCGIQEMVEWNRQGRHWLILVYVYTIIKENGVESRLYHHRR